jgi:signal transduction histidine kinase
MSNEGGLLVINLRMIPSSGGRDQIEVSISDNGPGIPEEIRERIFEPFFTTTSHGTGLGLSIAKRIVTAHKGTINVTSVPGGTVFQIIFPAFIS